MQIAKGFNQELISEAALRCNDIEYRDFTKEIYGQASYREERDIATEFSILERMFVVKVEKDDEDIILPLINFRAEFRLEINSISYDKVNELSCATDYILKYFDTKLVLDYQGKKKSDVVKIFYISLGDTGEEYDGTILLPNKYYHELLRRVCLHMARLGVAKFNNEKKEKYTSIYRLYSKTGYDPSLAADRPWATIKPFKWL